MEYATKYPVKAGLKYGHLTAIRWCGNGYWEFTCDCGKLVKTLKAGVFQGRTKSCGCMTREFQRRGRTKHGHYGNELYGIWWKMISRCHDPNNESYRWYGGRGISVCERWRFSVGAFIEDMGPRPSKLHEIDRENNDGNYEPGNCRWATAKQNSRNKRNVTLITRSGITQCASAWAEHLGI